MKPAEVISVYPNRIRVAVYDISQLMDSGEPVEVGSYLRFFDLHECSIIAIIESFSIELKPTKKPARQGGEDEEASQGADDEDREKVYLIDAIPLGLLRSDGAFERGGGKIAIPPKSVAVASKGDIRKIYDGLAEAKRFHFAQLAQDEQVDVVMAIDFQQASPGVDQLQSHAVAKIVQAAMQARDDSGQAYSLNNSHIIVFDIHSEYRAAFPDANYLSADSLALPYWLLNSEELQDMFIESNEEQSHNQVAILKKTITEIAGHTSR
jgi:hypothetical protein